MKPFLARLVWHALLQCCHHRFACSVSPLFCAWLLQCPIPSDVPVQHRRAFIDERAAAPCGQRAEDRVRCAGGDARATVAAGWDSAGGLIRPESQDVLRSPNPAWKNLADHHPIMCVLAGKGAVQAHLEGQGGVQAEMCGRARARDCSGGQGEATLGTG